MDEGEEDEYYNEEEDEDAVAHQRRMLLSGSSGREMNQMQMEAAMHEIGQQPDHHP
jgi:hypothetical protein